ATGVSYVDTATGQERQVRARIVVLAASACETARLLLNSKSPRHPAGLANSSGVVGRYLTDSTGSHLGGQIPALEALPPYNEDGTGGMHVYMPWWLDNKTLDFPRGYHIELGGGRRMPGFGVLGNIHRYAGTAAARNAMRGGRIPSADSYCEIDPSVVDRWGIPVLRFHFKWSDHELGQVKHMHETFR